MFKTNTYKKKVIHFSQWSRKAYAIFMSLGRDVKICRLAVGMCEQASLKLNNLIEEILTYVSEYDEVDEDVEQLELVMLPVVNDTKVARVQIKNKQINKIYKGCIG